MPIGDKVKPDNSQRIYVAPEVVPAIAAPARLPPSIPISLPIGSSNFNYNQAPVIPEYRPVAAAPVAPMLMSAPPLIDTTPIVTSGFSPNLETFAGKDNSYFALASGGGAGYTPNPSFSTITMAPIGGGNGLIKFDTNGIISFNGGSLGIADFNSGNGFNIRYATAPNGVSTFATQLAEEIWQGNSALMGIGQDGNQYIWNAGPYKTILASPTVANDLTTSSLTLVYGMSTTRLRAEEDGDLIIEKLSGAEGHLYCSTVTTSSMTTTYLNLDNNILTTDNVGATGELLLNGIPIATTANLSSIQDWAIYPAISTIDANNNNISSVKEIFAQRLNVSSIAGLSSINGSIYPPPLISSFQTLSVSSITDISTINGAAYPPPLISSFQTLSVSSITDISTINGAAYPPLVDNVSTFTNLFTSSFTVSSINGSAYPPAVGNVSTFSTLTTSTLNTNAILGTYTGIPLNPVENGLYLQGATTYIDSTRLRVPTTFNYIGDTTRSVTYVSTLYTYGSVDLTNPNANLFVNNIRGTSGFPLSINSDTALNINANTKITSTLTLSNGNFTIQANSGSIFYPNVQMDANVTVGNTGSLLFPNMALNVASFNIGTLASPATSISMDSLAAISLTSAEGVNITGGAGVSLFGGGGITAIGATINLGAGEIGMAGGTVEIGGGNINLGAGLISMEGGLITVGTGTLGILGGTVDVGAGLVAVGSGSITVGAGQIVLGTGAAAGGGLTAYGGQIIAAPSGLGGNGGVRIDGIAALSTNTITAGDSGNLQIKNLSSINGLPYLPAGGVSTFSQLFTSTLVASTINTRNISAATMTVSTIGQGPDSYIKFSDGGANTTIRATTEIILQAVGISIPSAGISDNIGSVGGPNQFLKSGITGGALLWGNLTQAELPTDPAFSTINLYPLTEFGGRINYATGGSITYSTNMTLLDKDSGGNFGFNYDTAGATISGVSTIGLTIVSGTATSVGAFVGSDNKSYIKGDGLTSLNVLLPTSISSLTVSSINGTSYPPQPVNAGLQNRLQIVPTLVGQSTSTVLYSAVGSPSSWIPDNTSYLPITGGNNNGWRQFKEVGTSGNSTKISWWPYNPYYGQSLPYTVNPSPVILKKNLNSLWAVIYTKNRINVQGEIFFNIFTYDVANPPTSPGNTFTNRFDYSILNFPTPEGSATNFQSCLAGGFRYLICAVDAPKYTQQTLVTVNPNAMVTGQTYTILTVGNTNWTAIGAAVATIGCIFVKNATAATGNGTASQEVNTSILIGNGQYPNQTGFLRDPYDIRTDIAHIPFSAVLVATNTPQPADPSSVAVSGIAISCTSGTISPTLDWTVEAIGYSANNGAQNVSYTLNYS